MNEAYRSHTCGQLGKDDAGKKVKLSGWVARKRDHGNLLFVDLRDHFGTTQLTTSAGDACHEALNAVRLESVVMITGRVVARSEATVNPKLATGEVEVQTDTLEVLSEAAPLPIQVETTEEQSEELRLKYRFLDLRRRELHDNIMLRTRVIASLRKRMTDLGFTEFSTPILTASSPEGARDFLVPSRLHPGKFYALPQAPQQFKQLIMVSGFDRYFQIAPCFRDEDARADRTAGEFYQLDLEMSFVEQSDVFEAVGTVIHGVFQEFAGGKTVSSFPFPQIPYRESMAKYGTDKPDLRNPILNADATEVFAGSGFAVFADAVASGAIVRAIPAPGAAHRPRSWFDKLGDWARTEGMAGLGYIIYDKEGFKGPLAKALDEERLKKIVALAGLSPGDAVFFVCGGNKGYATEKNAGKVRTKIGQDLDLIEKNAFRLCWITDFPFYETGDNGQAEFSHNPFSMPQGGLEALETKDPLDIVAYQYDIVCNGYEIASGAIRNHKPEIMYKAFAIAGYGPEVVEEKFGGMLNAFKFGAPPHGGCAPGIDRIVMLLAGEDRIREVIMFPMTQKAEDLMMSAPAAVSEKQLKELHIKPALPAVKKEG
ncbi:aspartate--tRNA(Asp/Asn) ligase [Alphaproteobacteria bacterium]|nr:aspartate--tRNA(Asp/Asn) ligase [Alphaproteobacteria bacterium]